MKHITDEELSHASALMRAAEARQKKRLTKRVRMIGLGKNCPRCAGPKPLGSCGKGISLSRRGKAAICAACGVEEGMFDMAKAQRGSIPACVIMSESLLRDKLINSGGLKEGS